jgi:hypothetical protein
LRHADRIEQCPLSPGRKLMHCEKLTGLAAR